MSRKCDGADGVSGLEGTGSCEAEGTSGELLKNTPSLEDQIEHCLRGKAEVSYSD